MSTMRLLGLLLTALGAAVVIYGFYDFMTADQRLGAPTGWYLLPVGGLLAIVGLGLIGRDAQHSSAEPFTDEELDRTRRERRGDD